MWQVYEGKKGTFTIIESETGEFLHSIGAGLWTHTDRVVANRVAKEANDLRYIGSTSQANETG